MDEKWPRFGFGQRSPSRRIEVWIYADKLTLEEQRELVQVCPLQFHAKFFKRSDFRGEHMRPNRIIPLAGLHTLAVYSIPQEIATTTR